MSTKKPLGLSNSNAHEDAANPSAETLRRVMTTDARFQRIEQAWDKLAERQRDALVEIAEIYIDLPAQVEKDKKRYAAQAKRKAAKAKRDAKVITPLLEQGDELNTELWRWLIDQSPAVKEVAYLQDGISIAMGALRGYIHFTIPRHQFVKSLRADITKARVLLANLKGAKS